MAYYSVRVTPCDRLLSFGHVIPLDTRTTCGAGPVGGSITAGLAGVVAVQCWASRGDGYAHSTDYVSLGGWWSLHATATASRARR